MQFARTTLNDRRAVIDLANRLHNYPKIGLDTESSGPDLIHKKGKNTSLNLYRSSLTGLSLALPGDWPESFYVPIGHKKHDSNVPLPALHALFESLSDYKGVIAAHNSKHELYSMKTGPIPFRGFAKPPHCTQVLAWLLQMGWIDKEGKMRYGLKGLAPHHFGVQMRTFQEVTGGLSFDQLDPSLPLARNYACEDAELALMLHDKLYPRLADYGLEEEYLDVELPFVEVLRHMEDSGMGLDTDELERVVDDLSARRDEWESRWNAILPGVAIRSSQQLQVLFQDGHWPKKGIPRGKSGDFSTEAEYVERILAALSDKPDSLGYKAAEIKLSYSKLNTLVTTFGMAMAEKSWQYPDLRLHCDYMHTGTATGRLAASYPNLMNIPTRTADGRRIRDAFVPAPGWKLVSADYSQIELRILAHYNGSGILYDGYRAGQDVHRATAAGLYNIPLDLVTDEQRSNGKTTNFLIIYGGGPDKLARKVGLRTKEEGKAFLQRFKEVNPESIKTLERAAKAAERKGYVRTLLGRFRRVDVAGARARYEELKALGHRWETSKEFREAWLEMGERERQAGNAPIQGGARDVITLAMIDFYRKMDRSRCKIVGQVHDDLLTEMREDYVEEGMALKRQCMENAYKLRVPLVAEPKAADRWSGLK